MTDAFHIIQRLESEQAWQQHDHHNQAQKRALLYQTAEVAEQRDLGRSATRYRPSQALLDAINAALAARAPLLLTGEPGTGKTQVAWYIQRFFGIPLYGYQVHSNSQASDMRYDFDAVAYLRDAYLAREHQQAADHFQRYGDDPRASQKYLKPGVLWQAYDPSVRIPEEQAQKECVLLIDEIDKAPRDFPNDLLQELDQHRFAHPFDAGRYIKRQVSPPITIITSNAERRLPDAFLRRCLVHHIRLDSDLLRDIMQAWQSQFPRLDVATRKMAQQRFEEIRENKGLSKLPGSAEFLLWLSVLSAQNIQLAEIDEDVPLIKLPALMCLIKDEADYRLL